MTRALVVHQAGPGVSVQDFGRPGYLEYGLSRGGAADRTALAEGAALLAQDAGLAALEMAAMGGVFETTETIRIALTGAPMRASLDGTALQWNASHDLPNGAKLTIGPAIEGVYGYLHLGGGIATHEVLHARSAHLTAGLGRLVQAGDHLPVGPDRDGAVTGRLLPWDTRFAGGTVRVVPSLQTDFFAAADLARFEATTFHRDARGNRMGVRMAHDGPGFESVAGLSVLSEIIVPGDIQIAGDGAPFVLMAECQTTGGYPRIGSVLPCDLPIVAQAPPKADIRFQFITMEDALEAERRAAEAIHALPRKLEYLRRDPRQMRDLLAHQLISGVSAGTED